jgi:protein TonB
LTAITVDTAVTDSDRLSLTLCLAILFHAILILGVSFIPPKIDLPNYESMEIVLVNSESSEKPEEAKLLAQASQLGGGEEDTDERPATPLTTPVPAAVAAVPMAPRPELTPQLPAPSPEPQAFEVSPRAETPVTGATAAERQAEETTTATQELVAEAVKELDRQLNETPRNEAEIQKQAEPLDRREDDPVREAEAVREPAPEQTAAVAPPAPAAPSGAALIARSFEIASLDAEIAERMEAKAKRPRRKFISATTSEYKFAAYMEAWRAKVERIGNLNYPDEARRNKLSGSLILDVALKSDGSIEEITVRKPSGHATLDDAAIRIVKLAAPYAAFPQEFNKEVDILHITRTWQFQSGDRFASQ